MSSTQYVVSIWLAKKEEKDFLTALRKYHQRESYSTQHHLALVATQEVPASAYSPAGTYVEISLSCTDVFALFKFGEFWGNKTMQRWTREQERDLPTKGGPAGG